MPVASLVTSVTVSRHILLLTTTYDTAPFLHYKPLPRVVDPLHYDVLVYVSSLLKTSLLLTPSGPIRKVCPRCSLA